MLVHTLLELFPQNGQRVVVEGVVTAARRRASALSPTGSRAITMPDDAGKRCCPPAGPRA
jgi:hypothetical protein